MVLNHTRSMKRVLLAIDEVKQRTFLQTFIMKFGVNVDAVSDPKLLDAELLKIMPNVIIITLDTATGKGEDLLEILVDKENTPPLIVLLKGKKASEIEGVTLVLPNTPLNIMDFVDALILCLDLNKEKTYERLHNIQKGVSESSQKKQQSKIISIDERALSHLSIYNKKHSKNIYLNPEKDEKYNKYLENLPKESGPANAIFDRSAVVDLNKQFRFKNQSAADEKLDAEKEKFLNSLLARMKK